MHSKSSAGEDRFFLSQTRVSSYYSFGFDHVLFITSVCIIASNLKTMIWQASAFTVAHSITLALAMKNVVVAPPALLDAY
jgi:hypothetical protein